MFGKKKMQNLKSSFLCYFMERNHEIWNINSNIVFPVKKTVFFDFKQKR